MTTKTTTEMQEPIFRTRLDDGSPPEEGELLGRFQPRFNFFMAEENPEPGDCADQEPSM